MNLFREFVSRRRPSLPARGQSETLGVVLVLGIMLVGAFTIVALGATAVNDTEGRLSDERAEKALTQLDSKAGLVALGEADSQFVRFPTDNAEQFFVREGAGWMNVTFTNQTSGTEREVMNVSMGAVVYQGQNGNVAYQGGGVFRADGSGGQMVSPPEFHFRNGTLTLPAVNVTGDSALGDSATITQNGVERKFPVRGDPARTNPLENHLVTVEVHSEYYEGWGDYFEQRTDGEVEYDHDNQTATLVLVSPIEITTVTSASSSLAANGDFTVNGNSATRCGAAPAGDRYTDSYDSSGTSKDYCTQVADGETNWNGDIVYGGDVDVSSGAGGSDFCGDIRAGGDVTLQATGDNDGSQCGEGQGGQPTVYGNVSHAGTCTDCSGALAGYAGAPFDVGQISGLDTVSQVDFYINNSLERIEDEADAVNPSLSAGTELGSGTYYFDSLTVASGDAVEFNTTGGNIEIAVDEDVDIQSGATITVVGDGMVQVYVGGNNVGTGDHFQMGDSATITNAGDNATKFRMYGKKNFNATLGGGGAGSLAKYVGVIYAPPGVDGSGEVVLNGGEIYGGLLTGTTRIPSGGTGSIHFDESLLTENIISPGASVVKVTYLHVTVNRIHLG